MLPELPPSLNHWVDNLMLTLFAAGAGFMGYLMRVANSDKHVKWTRALLEAGSSAVVGYMVVLACRAMNLSYEWIGVIVGTMGWLGATISIQILEKLVIKKLGINYDRDSESPDGEVRPIPTDSGGTPSP